MSRPRGRPRRCRLFSTDGAEMGKLMVAGGLGATVLPGLACAATRWWSTG